MRPIFYGRSGQIALRPFWSNKNRPHMCQQIGWCYSRLAFASSSRPPGQRYLFCLDEPGEASGREAGTLRRHEGGARAGAARRGRAGTPEGRGSAYLHHRCQGCRYLRWSRRPLLRSPGKQAPTIGVNARQRDCINARCWRSENGRSVSAERHTSRIRTP